MPSLSTSVSVDDETMTEQIGGGTAAEPASPTTTTATAGSEFEFEMRGDERLDEYVRTTYGSTKDWELSDDRTHPNYVNGKVIDDDGKFLIGIIIVEREDNDDEDKRKFDFVKGWVRESIGSGASVSGWEFDGETLTINHEDDDEVEQYTLDEIGYNEEDNSDGGGAATSATTTDPSTPSAEEGDSGDSSGGDGEEDECLCDTCGKSLKPEEQFSLSYGVLDSVMCEEHFVEAASTFYAQAPSAAMAHPAFGAYSIPDGSTLDVEALLDRDDEGGDAAD